MHGITAPGPGEVVVQLHSKPDALGRQMFAAYWIVNGSSSPRVRGQVFEARLDDVRRRFERQGRRVIAAGGVQRCLMCRSGAPNAASVGA